VIIIKSSSARAAGCPIPFNPFPLRSRSWS